jgi:hypothetical protein
VVRDYQMAILPRSSPRAARSPGLVAPRWVVFENGLTVDDIKASITRTLQNVPWMPEFENVMLLRHFQRLDPQPS